MILDFVMEHMRQLRNAPLLALPALLSDNYVYECETHANFATLVRASNILLNLVL